MNSGKIIAFLRKNYIITNFIACILFVGVVVVARSYFSKPSYVYVKVKVGQGLWWANTAKPQIWYVNSINKGDIAVDLLGKPRAEVLSKRYYRYNGSDQFDVYLTLKLRVGGNKKTGNYSFDRSALSVGTPIEVQFPNEDVTGTVISVSSNLLVENSEEKIVYLTKKYAHPWEFDSIYVGDSATDGNNVYFEVLEKSNNPQDVLSYSSYYTNSGANVLEPANYVIVKAKMRLNKLENQWLLNEDQPVISGRVLSISTANFVFENYIVTKIE